MKSHGGLSALSLVLVAGIVDCVALPIAVFAAFQDFSGFHPVLSVWILLQSFALLIILMLPIAMDERDGIHSSQDIRTCERMRNQP
jgi:hypothetical protein